MFLCSEICSIDIKKFWKLQLFLVQLAFLFQDAYFSGYEFSIVNFLSLNSFFSYHLVNQQVCQQVTWAGTIYRVTNLILYSPGFKSESWQFGNPVSSPG